jgi:transcriptional regulator with XRE-family HTH domain
MSKGRQEQQDLLVLGHAISQIRAERGMSMGDLSAATGLAPTLIQELERGRLDPSYETLLTVADGLGVRPSSFVMRAEELKAQRRPP